ncbi:MAG: hypothetical protein BWY06_02681 [Candidatus Latescibacteria bacterium ADurb.Bin168]|nr:MAG: hypothetical protein BWY06_02681 [Candidatus Latescibacteria bacterium ADurb.Bin168]
MVYIQQIQHFGFLPNERPGILLIRKNVDSPNTVARVEAVVRHECRQRNCLSSLQRNQVQVIRSLNGRREENQPANAQNRREVAVSVLDVQRTTDVPGCDVHDQRQAQSADAGKLLHFEEKTVRRCYVDGSTARNRHSCDDAGDCQF